MVGADTQTGSDLISLLSLYKLTVNNLAAMVNMEHKHSKPTVEQGSPNNIEHQQF
jgi:hypothetical protein